MRMRTTALSCLSSKGDGDKATVDSDGFEPIVVRTRVGQIGRSKFYRAACGAAFKPPCISD